MPGIDFNAILLGVLGIFCFIVAVSLYNGMNNRKD